MNFAAILWTFSIIIPICNAQQNYDLSLFSTSTFDVTITCNLSAFVEKHPSVISDHIESLQVVQHHSPQNKQRVLATLRMTEKTYEPSPFLNSSSRFFVLSAAADADNRNAWLSLSLSAVHEIPHNKLSYHCRVAYNDAEGRSGDTWNSKSIVFAAEPKDAKHPGIHVQIRRGLTLTCLLNSSHEDASAANTTIEILKKGEPEPTHLCSGDSTESESARAAATTKCGLEVFDSDALLARRRAHVFNPTCADDGLYLCTLSSPSASQFSVRQVSSPECSSLPSATDVAKRIGICLLIFAVGCLLVALVIYSIFLIFIPSSRPGKWRPLMPVHRKAYYNVANAIEEDEKYMGIRD